MRFVVMVTANEDSEAGVLPSKELITEMGKFNEEMARAGVLVAAEGLQPSSKGARVGLPEIRGSWSMGRSRKRLRAGAQAGAAGTRRSLA